MKKLSFFILLILLFSLKVYSAPPYDGTIFYFPNVINSTDPTTFQELIYIGKNNRKMYDRRKGGRWINKKAFLFNAIDEERIIEIQVNPEFKNSDIAFEEALMYSKVIGQLPNFLLTNVKTVWIHKGNEGWGGGNNNLLIHTGRSKEYIIKEILEEAFIHEAAHTSLDWDFGGSISKKDWSKAQKKDKKYISDYASKYPFREDVAESILTWIAARYHIDRTANHHIDTILKVIPNRLKYFDEQNFDMYPLILSD